MRAGRPTEDHPAAAPGTGLLAVDVGGTSLKGALLDGDLTVLAEINRPTREANRPPLHALLSLVDELREVCAARGLLPRAIGIAVPGVVDEESGSITLATNLGWQELPLRAIVAQHTDLPTALINDARAAAIAEHRLGSVGVDDFVIVPLGTGVGGSVMSGGRLLRGFHGAAGELGHIVVKPGGTPCACGARGCVEAYASGPAISRSYLAATGVELSTAEIALRAASDPAAAQVWQDAAEALALALAGMVAATDPRRIILAGGVAQAGRVLSIPLQAALADRLGAQAPPAITLSSLGIHAPRTGAALLAADTARSSPLQPVARTAHP